MDSAETLYGGAGAGSIPAGRGGDSKMDRVQAPLSLFKDRMDAGNSEYLYSPIDEECESSRVEFSFRGRGDEYAYDAKGGAEPPDDAWEADEWVSVSNPPSAREALGDLEDIKAAAEFEPFVPAGKSRILSMLSTAWSPQSGEVSDDHARGLIRAGQTAMDLGLRYGRAFRAGWGPGGKLVVGRGRVHDGSAPKGRQVQILQFDPTPATRGRSIQELYVEPLRNHQRHAVSIRYDIDKNVPPRWTLPKRSAEHPKDYEVLVRCIHGYVDVHASLATASDRDHKPGGRENSPDWILEQAWRLTNAIWGQEQGDGMMQDLPIPGEDAPSNSTAPGGIPMFPDDGGSSSSRREAAVAQWLADVVSPCVSWEVKDKMSSESPDGSTWRAVLELLSVRRVQDAAELAFLNGLPRLAIMISASAAIIAHGGTWVGAGHATEALGKQISAWQSSGADAHMPPEAFTVFQLLGRAGFRDMRLKGVIGKGSESLHPSLDWLRQLGLCLWFGAGANSSNRVVRVGIAEALHSYEDFVQSKEAYPPTSRYLREPTHNAEDVMRAEERFEEVPKIFGTTASPGRNQCVLRRLLALHPPRGPGSNNVGSTLRASVGIRLLAALEPLSVTPDVMDYRHSWHFMTVIEALGVAEVQNRSVAAAVAENLMFQLEVAGLWEWAVYVALTAEGESERREMTARNLIVRHGYNLRSAAPGSRDKERFELLRTTLQVPLAWFYEADAVHAG